MKSPARSLTALIAVFAASLCFLANAAFGDAPLHTALDLSTDQAAKVAEIQKQTREAIRPVRGELNREERVLRRARLAHDSEAIAKQEAIIAPLRQKFAAIFDAETKQIRAILTPEQNVKYDEYLKVRDAMVGSSRDVRELQEADAEPSP